MGEPAILDAKGLRCPLPVLKARKAMKALPIGATLRVLATDPGAIKDFEAFCRTTGYRLLSATQDGEVLTFDIQKID
jgi:tRNA 2-thiouridine synthesizing protein A